MDALQTLSFQAAGEAWTVDLTLGISIAIPLFGETAEPSCFSAPPSSISAFSGPGFSGRVSSGASCNVSTLTINPHCNGTHTESIAHLLRDERGCPVGERALNPQLGTLVTLEPRRAELDQDRYNAHARPHDLRLSRAALEASLANTPNVWLSALVIRTRCARSHPNRVYQEPSCVPYLTPSAMSYLRERGVLHLLIDSPSVDRLDDGGELLSHRAYWGLEPGVDVLTSSARVEATITEMIEAPDTLPDGHYLISIGAPALAIDATPSRPVLFPVQKREETP